MCAFLDLHPTIEVLDVGESWGFGIGSTKEDVELFRLTLDAPLLPRVRRLSINREWMCVILHSHERFSTSLNKPAFPPLEELRCRGEVNDLVRDMVFPLLIHLPVLLRVELGPSSRVTEDLAELAKVAPQLRHINITQRGFCVFGRPSIGLAKLPMERVVSFILIWVTSLLEKSLFE